MILTVGNASTKSVWIRSRALFALALSGAVVSSEFTFFGPRHFTVTAVLDLDEPFDQRSVVLLGSVSDHQVPIAGNVFTEESAKFLVNVIQYLRIELD